MRKNGLYGIYSASKPKSSKSQQFKNYVVLRCVYFCSKRSLHNVLGYTINVRTSNIYFWKVLKISIDLVLNKMVVCCTTYGNFSSLMASTYINHRIWLIYKSYNINHCIWSKDQKYKISTITKPKT